MAQFNYAGLANQLKGILATYGYAPGQVLLRRHGLADRAITALEAMFKPNEIDGVLVLKEDLRFLIASDVMPPPEEDVDLLVISQESEESVYKIMSKPERMSPGGVNVFWQVHVRRIS